MEKIQISLFFYIIMWFIPNLFAAQNSTDLSGTFAYKANDGSNFEEILILQKNGKFFFSQKTDSISKSEIVGNWQQRGRYLILDSHPQKEKVLVYSTYNKKNKGTLIRVTDKKWNNITYDLYIFTNKNDTILHKNKRGVMQADKSAITGQVIDSYGTKSPYFMLTWANEIEVLFETQRIFENEYWEILDDITIQPLDSNGNPQKYILLKKSNINPPLKY